MVVTGKTRMSKHEKYTNYNKENISFLVFIFIAYYNNEQTKYIVSINFNLKFFNIKFKSKNLVEKG